MVITNCSIVHSRWSIIGRGNDFIGSCLLSRCSLSLRSVLARRSPSYQTHGRHPRVAALFLTASYYWRMRWVDKERQNIVLVALLCIVSCCLRARNSTRPFSIVRYDSRETIIDWVCVRLLYTLFLFSRCLLIWACTKVCVHKCTCISVPEQVSYDLHTALHVREPTFVFSVGKLFDE